MQRMVMWLLGNRSRIKLKGGTSLTWVVPLLAFTFSEAALVEHTWNVRPSLNLSPDCFLGREALVVNDVMPGPELRANVGDTVRITVVNHDPTRAIAIHYHGLLMKDQPYADGSGTITQCLLGPLQSEVNTFIAQDPGTHYWHAHNSLSRGDGLQGLIVITDPNDEGEKALGAKYDEERVVFLQDWYHMEGDKQRTGLDSVPFRWVGNPQSLLINGKAIEAACALEGELSESDVCADDCTSTKLERLEVEPGKIYRLRIVNAASLMGLNFAVANHTLTVVEADGTLVDPFEVENLDVTVGQRYSVLLKADKEPNHYGLSVTTRFRKGTPPGLGFLSYADAGATPITFEEQRSIPQQPAWDDLEALVALDTRLRTADVSIYDSSDVLKEEPDRRIFLVRTQNRKSNGQLRWAINNVSQAMTDVPVIASAYWAAKEAGTWPVSIPDTIDVPDYPPNTWNYSESVHESVGGALGQTGVPVIRLNKGDIVEVIMQNARALNDVAEAHYYHLHGHAFWIVGQGHGNFDENIHPETYNLVNPVRRDTLSLWPLGWTAFRFRADNPGVWAFHCAISSHFVMGQGLLFVVQPDELPPLPPAVTACMETSLDPKEAKICKGGNAGVRNVESSAVLVQAGAVSFLVLAFVFLSVLGL